MSAKLLKTGNLDDRLVSIEDVVEELQGQKSSKSGGLTREDYERISSLDDRVETLEDQVSTLQTQLLKLQSE